VKSCLRNRPSGRGEVVADAPLRVPADPLVELVARTGFVAADDWIAERAGPGDIVVTADAPLAARCLAGQARVLGPKGRPFTDNGIGSALARRDLVGALRQGGAVTGGPGPMTEGSSPIPRESGRGGRRRAAGTFARAVIPLFARSVGAIEPRE
jgi:uncharacterized protein YaiI (UPF0178 family)